MAAATLWRMRWDDDMEPAIALAREAAADGEVPVGAVVLAADGRVIGRGRNLRETYADPLAHAEVKAMAEAAASLDTWNLADCTLVVTLEPCPMCAGACLQTHIGRIVFGARADANYFPKETNTQGDGKKSGMQYHQSVIPTKNRKKRMLQ